MQWAAELETEGSLYNEAGSKVVMIEAAGMTCSNTVYYTTDKATVILSRFTGRIVDET